MKHPLIRFLKPNKKNVPVFIAFFLGVLAITYILSASGTFAYRNCVFSIRGFECFNAELTLLGLPNFYVGDHYEGEVWVPPAFVTDMFAVNIILWYLVACSFVLFYNEAMKRATVPKIKRLIKKVE